MMLLLCFAKCKLIKLVQFPTPLIVEIPGKIKSQSSLLV